MIGLMLIPVVSVMRASAPRGPLPVIDGKWRHLTSPHFEVYSRNSDSDSRELLHNLEILRAVFFERLNLKERLHLDVTVYYFRSSEEFLAYAPQMFQNQSELAGFHLFQSDRAVISIAPNDDSEAAQQTVFHEYVHHLFHICEEDPPLWFNEGTADVLAGMKVEKERVLIGAPFEGRAAYLRTQPMIPLEQLFAADQKSNAYTQENHTGVFYAESWALLHFLRFGNTGFSKEAVEKFLRVASDREAASKIDLRKFFQGCFGCDYPDMERRLQNYIMRGSYHAFAFPLPKIDPASSYVARAVPVDEITVRLAELAVRVLHSGAGELVLLNAMTERPHDPRSFEALGSEAFVDNDERTATQRWEQAVEAGSQNPAIVRELALMEGRRWLSDFNDSLQLPEEVAARMRARLLHSIEIEPAQGASYEMLAWVEAFSATPNAKNINLVIGHLSTMNGKKRTLIGLSRVMIRLRKYDTASMMLKHLGTLALDQRDANAVAILRGRLDEEFPHEESTGTPSKPGEVQVAPPPLTPGLATPSVTVPADL